MSADKLDLKDLDAENVHRFSKRQLRQWLTRNDVLLPKKEQDEDFFIKLVLRQLDEDRELTAHEKSFSVPTKAPTTPSKQERMFAGLRRPSPPRPRSERGTPRKKAPPPPVVAAPEEVDERAARRERSFIGMNRPAPPSSVKRGRSARARTPERKKVAKRATASPKPEAKHDAKENEEDDADAAVLRAAALRRRTLGISTSTIKKRAAVSRTASSRARRSTMAPASDKETATHPASPGRRRRGRPKKSAPLPQEEQPTGGSDEEADVDMASVASTEKTDDTTDVEEEAMPRSPARRSTRRGGRPTAAAPTPSSSRRSPRRRTTGGKRKQDGAELPHEPEAEPGADPVSPPRSAHEVIDALPQDDSDLSESQPGTQKRKKAKTATATASPRRTPSRTKRPVAATRTRSSRVEKDSPQKAQKRTHPQTPQEARKGGDPTKKEAKLSASGEKIKDYDFSSFPERPSPPRPKTERGTPKKEKREPPKSSRTRTPPSSAVKKRATRSTTKRKPKQEKQSEEDLFTYVNDKLSGNLGGGDDDESDTDVDVRLGAALATPPLATPYKYNTTGGKKKAYQYGGGTSKPASSQRKNPTNKPVHEEEPKEEQDGTKAREFLSASHFLQQDFPEEAPREFNENEEYGFDFDLDSTADTDEVHNSSLRVTRVQQRDLGVSDAESDISVYTDVSGKKTYRPDAPSSTLHESTRQSEDLSFLDKSDFLEPAVSQPARPKRARKGRVSVAKRVSPRGEVQDDFQVPASKLSEDASHSFLDMDPNDSFVNWSNDGGARVAASNASRGKGKGTSRKPAYVAKVDEDARVVPSSLLPPPDYLSDGGGVASQKPSSKQTPGTTLSAALDSQAAREAHRKDFSIISFNELDLQDEESGAKPKAKPKKKSRAKPDRRSKKFVEEEFFSDDDPVSPIKPAVASPGTVAASRRRPAGASRSLSTRRQDRSASSSSRPRHTKQTTRRYPLVDEELVSSDDEYKTTTQMRDRDRDRRSTSVSRRRMVASDDYIDYTSSRGPSHERDLPAEYSPPRGGVQQRQQGGGGGGTGTSLAMMLVVVCVIFMFALTLIALSRGGNHSYSRGGDSN